MTRLAATSREPRIVKTRLFHRLMIQLTLPIILLGIFIAALQLTNQIRHINEFNFFKSRSAITAFKLLFNETALNFSRIVSADDKQTIAHLKKTLGIDSVTAYDFFNRDVLFATSQNTVPPLSNLNAEKITETWKSHSFYTMDIDKGQQQLAAHVIYPDSEGPKTIIRLDFSLAGLKDALKSSRWVLLGMLLLMILIAFFIVQGLARSVVKPIQELNEATREIMSGHFGKQVNIHTGDEIELLADTFNHMSNSLKTIQQKATDANPLTQFPGNIEIYHEIQKRISNRQKMVLFHTDLDRFKIYNDTYGLICGDDAIRKTAQLLKDAVKEYGHPSDFIGHQGGDDFILITRPQYAEKVARYITSNFEGRIKKSLYSKEDYEKGFTLAPDRRNILNTDPSNLVKFPLIGISLAGVSNEKKDFADHVDCLKKASPVKKEVKQNSTSSYIIRT